MGAVVIGKKRTRKRGEAIQVRKAGAVGVNLKHRAGPRTAAIASSPIQNVAGKNQPANRIGPVAIGTERTSGGREAVQVRKTRAIGIYGKQRPATRGPAIIR